MKGINQFIALIKKLSHARGQRHDRFTAGDAVLWKLRSTRAAAGTAYYNAVVVIGVAISAVYFVNLAVSIFVGMQDHNLIVADSDWIDFGPGTWGMAGNDCGNYNGYTWNEN